MFRIQLVSNTSAKNPNAEKIVLVTNYDSLVKQASAKFNFKPKKLRLFVTNSLISAKAGTEIYNEEDLEKIIVNDIMLTVSNGDEFKKKSIKSKLVPDELLTKIKNPPRFPYPGKNIINIQLAQQQNQSNSQTHQIQQIQYQVNLKETNWTKELEPNSNFPIFNGNILGLIKKTIENESKIIQTESNGFVSFDYDDDMVFPDPKTWEDYLVRECRGLIVSTVTGCILARRFHKFFNINEKNFDSLPNTENFTAYEKLDGTLTSPILLDFDKTNCLVWATRKSINEEITQFVLSSPVDYNTFSIKWLKQNITPIFEYCHDTIAVSVLCYPTKQLVLTALRHNQTGLYTSIDNITEVPVVSKISGFVSGATDLNSLITKIKNQVGTEGIVLYTSNHNLFKCKTSWYVNTVSAQNFGTQGFLLEYVKRTKTLKNVPREKIFQTAITNPDDVIAEVCMLLINDNLESEAKELRNFIQIVQNSIKILESELKHWIESSFKIIQDKDAVLTIAENAGWNAEMLSDFFEAKSITPKLKSFLSTIAKRHKVDVLVEILGINWDTTKNIIDTNNKIIDTIQFDKLDEEIQHFVLTKYISKKFANLVGQKQLFFETIINIPDSYVGSEGKIIGCHESIAEKFGLYDLRVDLQAPRKDYDHHNGNHEYALILVQSGKVGEKSLSYAGIMIPTNSDNLFGDIIDGFKQSFETRNIIKLRRKAKLNNTFKIFCDLDGVLVDFEKGINDLTGKPIKNQTTSKMWQRVANCLDFFERLEFTSYGKEMWKTICEIYQAAYQHQTSPVILTGIPSGKIRYDLQKLNWCKKHLGEHVNVITCMSHDKHKYCSSGAILIDDRLELGRQWVAAGGIFVHHIDPARTIYQLNEIFGRHNKLKMNIVESDLLNLFISKFQPSDAKIITNVWDLNLENVNIITIDSEWAHNLTKNPVSIVQICTSVDVYIVDMINANAIVRDQLVELLTNPNILKLCWGMSEVESNNIGSDIINLIDLQEICKNHYNNFTNGHVPSLNMAVSSLLSKSINKSKNVQLSNWDIRPLTDEQLVYAINDVEVLFDIFEVLKVFNVPPKNVHNSKSVSSISARKTKLEHDTNIPVVVLFSGIFLAPGSRDEILKLIEPVYDNICANYAVVYNANENLKKISDEIGNMVSFKIARILINDNAQLVECKCKNDLCYIILSTKTQLYDNTAKTYIDNINSFDAVSTNITIPLFGTIGVFVQQDSDELAGLNDRIKNKILEFEEFAKPNENLKFKPNELSAVERSIVHEYARNHNMISESNGLNTERQLILTMKRKTENSHLNEIIRDESKEKFKVCDKSLFNLLIIKDTNIQNKNTQTQSTIQFAAQIGLGQLENISENLNNKLNCNNKLIILRGLPGSGKSHLANCLVNSFTNSEVCSADNYFGKNEAYNFDPNLLKQAHDYCYNVCVEYLQNKVPTVIIDNTNSTLKEYAKYIAAANCFGYVSLVLEIPTKTEELAKEFIKRSIHSVSMSDGLKMFGRWETDDNAFLIESHVPNCLTIHTTTNISFHQWLTNMKLYHFSKLRNKSHMTMPIGNQPAMFLDVPDNLYDEFIERYADAANSSEYMYLMECSSRFEYFRFFVDFDYVGTDQLIQEQILEYALTIQGIVRKLGDCVMYVSGCIDKCPTGYKSGLHLKFPNFMVNKEKALKIINECEATFSMLDDTKNWDLIFDKCVYENDCGIRMVFSRKSTNSVDVGRVHKLMFALDSDSNLIDINNMNTKNVVRLLSIYNK